MQGRKRDADVESGLVDTAGKERVGQVEKGALIYTHWVYACGCISCSVVSNSLQPH